MAAAESLTPLLADPVWKVRAAAACALLRIKGPKSVQAGDVLIESLSNPDHGAVALEPAALAGAIQEGGAEFKDRAVSALVAMIRSEEPERRTFALDVFKAVKGDASKAVPALQARVKELQGLAGKRMISTEARSGRVDVEDANLSARAQVASALVAIQGKSSFVGIAALLDAVTDPTVGVSPRSEAYAMLVKTDRDALRLVVPTLIEMLDDADAEVAAGAARYLRLIDPKALHDARQNRQTRSGKVQQR